jgi:hypothetical protein
MAIQRAAPQASVAEVLDRVLDRGIVIDAWLRVSVAGIALIDVDARVVVASISTYVRESDAMARTPLAARPARSAPGTPPEPAVPPAAPAPRAARRRAPRPRVTLHCLRGCTFTRAAGRRPGRVRCPADPGLTCTVAALVPAA